MMKERFGPYITSLREGLGISKAELGRRTNMTRSYIGFIEDDAQPPSMEPPNVKPHKLTALARELNVPEQEMFDRGYQTPPGFRLVIISSSGPAAQLVREQITELKGDGKITAEEVEAITGEVKDYARVRAAHRLRQG